MIYKAMKSIIPIILAVILFSCTPAQQKDHSQNFTKGVYGNPGTLLDAGYAFDSLGMNAVFVRSISLDSTFYRTAKKQGCRVYVEFPTLNGKNYVENHPGAWPIDEKGEKAPPADWFMGVCPTDTSFKAHRKRQLNSILEEFDVDGIFLDYVHWHAQFETADPILPETCFCDRCTNKFASANNLDIPDGEIPEKASWILNNADKKWRKWRNDILNEWVEDMGAIVENKQPEALLGVYYCAWYPDDHDSALYRTLGIDVSDLAARADVLSPMLFHKMKDRPTAWVGEYLTWLDQLAHVGENGTPLVWPIVQAHNQPVTITPEEFRTVMRKGTKDPSSGIMMFSDHSLLEDPRKIDVMKKIYHQELP